MNILVTNDDGYTSPGLANLAVSMRAFGHVDVIAPKDDRSGAGSSITLDRPLRVGEAESGFAFVNGTPVDCVNLGVTALLKSKPSLIVAGINNGRNIGEDVHYSGTVGAATEGFLHGITSFAFSLDSFSFDNLRTANFFAKKIVEAYLNHPFSEPTLLNVNIPNVRLAEIKGIVSCRPGGRAASKPAVKAVSPKGEEVYWVGASGDFYDVGEGTDFKALSENMVSITRLSTGMYETKSLEKLESWVQKIK
ncbi:5'/3'-nucleotidase SurE [Betaproteobacteria bacterium]|nr:5'/3'-nucleotidase SurE [Betaproteobacteria bacterium]